MFRKISLIENNLPLVRRKILSFPNSLQIIKNRPKIGSWTLLDENNLIASNECSSLFPNGEALFEEDKVNPSSRAYLKLWEIFSIIGRTP